MAWLGFKVDMSGRQWGWKVDVDQGCCLLPSSNDEGDIDDWYPGPTVLEVLDELAQPGWAPFLTRAAQAYRTMLLHPGSRSLSWAEVAARVGYSDRPRNVRSILGRREVGKLMKRGFPHPDALRARMRPQKAEQQTPAEGEEHRDVAIVEVIQRLVEQTGWTTREIREACDQVDAALEKRRCG